MIDNKTHWISGIVLLLISVSFGGCRQSNAPAEKRPVAAEKGPDIICTSWHLQSIANELTGNNLAVGLIAPPEGFSWKNRREFFPSDADVEKAASATLILDNGPGVRYAAWIDISSLPEDKICNAAIRFNIDDLKPVHDYQIVHSHGPEGEHSHDYMVPYCWHHPGLIRKQVDTVSKSITANWPEQKEQIQDNAAEIDEKLRELSSAFEDTGALLSAQDSVVIGSPDLEYLAAALKIDPHRRLWMGSDENKAEWEKRKIELLELATNEKPVLLLWPGQLPEYARSIDWGTITVVEVDMMEADDVERRNLLERLEALLKTMNRLAAPKIE